MNELQNIEYEEKERFEITDDSSLSWVFREVLIPLKAEVERTKALAEVENNRIRKWEEDKLRGPLQDIGYWEQRVAEYHLDLLSKDPKQKTISTPYGKSKTVRTQAQVIKGDEEDLMEYVKANGFSNLIKVEKKESVVWTELKKKFQVVGNNVVDENGEIVEGAKVKPETVTCKVEVN